MTTQNLTHVRRVNIDLMTVYNTIDIRYFVMKVIHDTFYFSVYNYLTDTLRMDYCTGYYQSDYFYLLILGDRAAPTHTKLSSWSKVCCKEERH